MSLRDQVDAFLGFLRVCAGTLSRPGPGDGVEHACNGARLSKALGKDMDREGWKMTPGVLRATSAKGYILSMWFKKSKQRTTS
jgi:hypothetical protein